MIKGLTGHPDETYGRVRAGDVVEAIRHLAPGFHSQDEVRDLYYEATGKERNADERYVSGIVTRLGLTPFIRHGRKGWMIRPAELALRWPRLPWKV